MRTGLIALLVCGMAEGVSATPLYTFSGTLTGTAPSTETNPALRELTAGDHFSGSFWYTFNEAPLPAGSPSGGTYVPSYEQSYSQPNLIFSLFYEIHFDTLSVYGHGGTGDIGTAPVVRIGNDTEDSFSLNDTRPDSTLVSGLLSEFMFGLRFANTSFADRSLPSLLDPASFLGGDLRMTFLPNPCTACYDLSGTIDTLEAHSVPEPAGWMLGMLGVAAALEAKRRHRRPAASRV